MNDIASFLTQSCYLDAYCLFVCLFWFDLAWFFSPTYYFRKPKFKLTSFIPKKIVWIWPQQIQQNYIWSLNLKKSPLVIHHLVYRVFVHVDLRCCAVVQLLELRVSHFQEKKVAYIYSYGPFLCNFLQRHFINTEL